MRYYHVISYDHESRSSRDAVSAIQAMSLIVSDLYQSYNYGALSKGQEIALANEMLTNQRARRIEYFQQTISKSELF